MRNEPSLAQGAGYMVLSILSPHEDPGTGMFGLELLPVSEKLTETPVPATPPAFLSRWL